MLLTNGLSTFFIKDNRVFTNSFKSLPKNPPGCPTLCNRIFDNFILADEPFVKALPSLNTCVLVNNDLCGKLFSALESPATFEVILKVTSVLFFIPDINFLRCELENLHLKYHTE